MHSESGGQQRTSPRCTFADDLVPPPTAGSTRTVIVPRPWLADDDGCRAEASSPSTLDAGAVAQVTPPRLAGDLSVLLRDLFAPADAATALLHAANAQARALAAVWAAHAVGAITLPAEVAAAVDAAREAWPAPLRPPANGPTGLSLA
jgi:hypothetical protein